jgi:hypothetical protein
MTRMTVERDRIWLCAVDILRRQGPAVVGDLDSWVADMVWLSHSDGAKLMSPVDAESIRELKMGPRKWPRIRLGR